MKGYGPLGGALELFRCRDKEILFCGPARTGKSRSALEKLLLFGLKYPGARILISRKTRTSMTESTLALFERFVSPQNAPWLEGPKAAYRQAYTLPNGSKIVVCGLDNVERIKSSEYDMIVVDEATELDLNDHEVLMSRLSGRSAPYRQIVEVCNPSAPSHWLKLRADSGGMTHIKSTFADNPVLDDDVIATLSRLTGHRRERLYLGNWAAAEGLIFDLSNSVVKAKKPPKGDIYCGVDFGFSAPFAAVVATLYKDENLKDIIFVHNERKVNNTPIEVHGEWIKANAGLDAILFCDPESPESIRQLNKSGLCAIKACNAVLFGIDRVNAAIEGKRLYISSSCVKLLEECQAYCYADDGVKPVKVNDHLADALRYLVAGINNWADDDGEALETPEAS